MFKLFKAHIFFEGEAGGGGGAAPAAPAAPAPAPAPGAPAPAPGAPAPAPAPGAPAPAPAGPDYAKQIADWGGDEAVADAVALRKALGTPEGVKALFMEAGRAQGLGDETLTALFEKQAGGSSDPIADLLADPSKQLTAGEVVALMDAREKKLRETITAETGATNHAAAMSQAVDSTLTDLKVSDEDRAVVLALADTALGKDAANATPQEAAAAIRKGKDAFDALVQKRAEAYVQEKHDKSQQLPTPLSGGGTSGGTPLPEPTSLDEAKNRVRAALAANG